MQLCDAHLHMRFVRFANLHMPQVCWQRFSRHGTVLNLINIIKMVCRLSREFGTQL